MRYLAITLLLVLAVIGFENLSVKPFEHIPLSQPTPVEQFMRRIAWFESGNNHKVVNQYGMMGKYQFSHTTVRGLGFTVTRKEFLSNPQLQDSAMVALMKYNHRELEPYIEKYDGKTFKGIKISRAAILAGAHFAGAGGVKTYFHSSDPNGTIDGNGTSLRKYMSLFSNVQLPSL